MTITRRCTIAPQRLRLSARLVLLAVWLGLAARPAQAATLNVPAQYPTLQAAVDAAQAGDEILIAARNTPYQIGDVRRSTPYPPNFSIRGSGGDPALTVLEGSIEFRPLGAGNVTLTVSGLTLRKGSSASSFGLRASHERLLRSNQTAYSTTLAVVNCIVEGYLQQGSGTQADWGAHLIVLHSVIRNNSNGISVGHPPTTDTLPSIVFSQVSVIRSVIASNRTYGTVAWGGLSPGFVGMNGGLQVINLDHAVIALNGVSAPGVFDVRGIRIMFSAPNIIQSRDSVFYGNRFTHYAAGDTLKDLGGTVFIDAPNGQVW